MQVHVDWGDVGVVGYELGESECRKFKQNLTNRVRAVMVLVVIGHTLSEEFEDRQTVRH